MLTDIAEERHNKSFIAGFDYLKPILFAYILEIPGLELAQPY